MSDACGWLGRLMRRMGRLTARKEPVDRSAPTDIGTPTADGLALHAQVEERLSRGKMVFDADLAEVEPLALAVRQAGDPRDAAVLAFHDRFVQAVREDESWADRQW